MQIYRLLVNYYQLNLLLNLERLLCIVLRIKTINKRVPNVRYRPLQTFSAI